MRQGVFWQKNRVPNCDWTHGSFGGGYALHNGFELDRVFNIDSPVASPTEIKNMIGWRATRMGRRIILKPGLARLRSRRFYVENGLTFNKEIASLPERSYITGYWQSEKYFQDYEALIREQFTFKPQLSGKNSQYVEQIQNSNAISLHIRRGDYVSNLNTNAVHGTCTIAYYQKAMAYVEDQTPTPIYYVFSDDVAWVKVNLNIAGECYFINHNQRLESFNDMRLMSLCKHHIIANSSFSWWGAWLNSKKDKIVIAPRRWFANGADSTTHVPKDWLRV